MSRYGFGARIDAIVHKLRHPTHRVKWRYDPGLLCAGDIVCNTCDHCFWCRVHDMSQTELTLRITRLGL